MSGTRGKPANTFDQFCKLELVSHFIYLEIGSQKAGVRGHLQQAVELGQSDFHHVTPPGQPPRVAGQQASSMPPSLSSLLTASSSRLQRLSPYSLQSPTLPSQFLRLTLSSALHPTPTGQPCFLSPLGCWLSSLQKNRELGWGEGGAEG